MRKALLTAAIGLGVALLVLPLTAGGSPAGAQQANIPPGATMAQSSTATVAAPTLEQAVWHNVPPARSPAQMAQLARGINSSYPHPEIDYSRAPVPGTPDPATATTMARGRGDMAEPRAPDDIATFRLRRLTGTPATYNSNVAEASVAQGGRFAFMTYNWYAARSIFGGNTWVYMSPFSGMADFCCDQVTIYDPARDLYLWLRMGLPDGNGVNRFLLSVSQRNAFQSTFWNYNFYPTNVNAAWTNEWWDYPHMAVGADYLYISWNIFSQAGSWQRSVMLRFPLDAIAAATGFTYNYMTDANWFTFVPVAGADHTMYFASNWGAAPYDDLRIWRWDEDSTGLSYWTRAVPAWTPTGRGDAHCGSPNWTGRLDQRLLTGARYEVSNDGITDPRQRGRKVLGWWWNVAEGGSFTYPYIDGAAFYEEDLTLLPGYLGRPYVFGSWCFAYPSAAPNARGDLGLVFNYAMTPNLDHPMFGYSVADDISVAPPGWNPVVNVRTSNAGPSDIKWGDYNTVRPMGPASNVWAAGGHWIRGATNCSNCSEVVYVAFGRERDRMSWTRWWNK